MSEPQRGVDLAQDVEFSGLFRAWIQGHRQLGDAAGQWREYLAVRKTVAGTAGEPAPAWAATTWREAWLAEQLTDLPDEDSRRRCRQNVALLVKGRAETVITGQQPGFLGGPLYTLLKVAATVAAAAARSEAGHPTVPLFWMGDDDDDRREAFQAVLYDPRRGAILLPVVPEGAADTMVGAAPASTWGRGGASWLQEQAGRNELAHALSLLWQMTSEEDLTWGRLQRRALLRVFRGTDLLVISGNDPRLHGAAAPFYHLYWSRHGELASAVQERARQLQENGFHAQIAASSFARPLNLADGRRRLAWAGLAGQELPPAERLRPGVAARSPVQDWLFRPAGVVVGPGELAYLEQLEPLYMALGLPRAPLLPRLFAQLVPEGQRFSSAETTGSSLSGFEDSLELTAVNWEEYANQVTAGAEALLAETLQREVGSDRARAVQLARQQAKRWRRSVAQLMAREQKRRQRGFVQAEGVPWLHPLGKRQERSLAAHCATALWGDRLMPLILAAARSHFTEGAAGHWWAWNLAVEEI